MQGEKLGCKVGGEFPDEVKMSGSRREGGAVIAKSGECVDGT